MANTEHLAILEQGMTEWNKWRYVYPDIRPDLTEVKFRNSFLRDMNLRSVNLSRANLSRASLNHADLSGATLDHANLSYANLTGVNFTGASLTGASLTGAGLYYASLKHAKLSGTKFYDALVGATDFANSDLRDAVGLESVRHSFPSEVSISTIYRSQGQIPEVFLRGCGVPDEFITYMRSLVAHPIQFYSCFISHSSKNQLFADRLYADLQNKGVRCWLASEDLKIGEKIRIGIDESVRFHDKLLLVLSKYSVASDWVEQEVETALDCERKQKRTVLFPIRLDDTVMKIDTGWPALIKNTRNIGDFRKWRNPESYQKAFARLLRDLKAEEK